MKDPAALLYIDKWFLATKEMKAHCRGWYLNLILHQFDKTDLPNDIEELANLADVRMSEYQVFEQVFEQVLSKHFELNEKGRLENAFAKEILRKREIFKGKRSTAGKTSYIVQFIAKYYPKIIINQDLKDFFYENFDYSIDFKNKQVFKQVIEQTLELYINENEDNNGDSSNKIDFEIFWNLYDKKVGEKNKIKRKWNKLSLSDQNSVLGHVDKYKLAQPEKQFRKNPETYLNNKSWNDEIISNSSKTSNSQNLVPNQPTKFEKLKASFDGVINPYEENSNEQLTEI